MDFGRKLQARRKALGLTLVQAAKAAGLDSYQTVYKIEHGKRAIKVGELVALAKAYALDVNYFLMSDSRVEQAQVFWRAEPPPPNAPRFEALFRMYLDRFLHLLDILRYESTCPRLLPITRRIVSVLDAAEEGERYRKSLNLADRPALTFRRILEEEYNVPIFYMDMPQGSSASTVLSSNQAVAIVINRKEVPWRRNFDIAHELFHVVYRHSGHDQCNQPSGGVYEQYANAFASALLLPRDSLEEEIARKRKQGSLGIADLAVIACDYDVSIDALVWRLVNLNRLTRTKAEQILSTEEVRDYYKSLGGRPAQRPPCVSARFLCMVYEAVSRGLMSQTRAAEYLNIPAGSLDRVFADAGLVLEGITESEISV